MLDSRPHTKSQIMFIFCSKNLHEPGPLLGSSSITAGGAKKGRNIKDQKTYTKVEKPAGFFALLHKTGFWWLDELARYFFIQ